MIKISYLVAVYNKQDFIKDAIDSILNETDSVDNFEVEICIVDDGSIDNSYQLIVNEYSNHKNIKIAKLPENRGKNSAYNLAFSMSTGDYICVFGADDVVVPGRTRAMLKAAVASGKSVYGGLVAKDESLRVELFRQFPCSADFSENVMGNKLSGGCSLLARGHLLNVFPIPENLKFEDWWLSYLLTRDNLVHILNEVVTIYRIHNSNDCGSSSLTYEAKKKDYQRHLPYFIEMRRVAKSAEELKLIKRSEDLRLAYLRKTNITTLAPIRFDKYWTQLFAYLTIGPRATTSAYGLIRHFRRKLQA